MMARLVARLMAKRAAACDTRLIPAKARWRIVVL